MPVCLETVISQKRNREVICDIAVVFSYRRILRHIVVVCVYVYFLAQKYNYANLLRELRSSVDATKAVRSGSQGAAIFGSLT